MEDGKRVLNGGGGFISLPLGADFKMLNNYKGVRLIIDWNSLGSLINEREPVLFRFGVYWEYLHIDNHNATSIVYHHDFENEYPEGLRGLLNVSKNPKGRLFKKIYESIDTNFGRNGVGAFDTKIDVVPPPSVGMGYQPQPKIYVGIANRIFYENHIEDYKRINSGAGSKLVYENDEKLFYDLEFQMPKYDTKLVKGGNSDGYQIIRVEQHNR